MSNNDWTMPQYFRHCSLNASRMSMRCQERAAEHRKAGNDKLADTHLRFMHRFEGRAAAFRHAAEVLEADKADVDELTAML